MFSFREATIVPGRSAGARTGERIGQRVELVYSRVDADGGSAP